MSSHRVLSGLSLLAALIFLAAGPGSAAAQLFDPRDSCTTTNCGSVFLFGEYRFDNLGRPLPVETEILGDVGECLRVDVLSQGTDLEITLIAPNGTVFRNDDSGGSCALCPLVKVNTPASGWYTLQISHFGGGGIPTDFLFAYGRYTSGNPNCSSPTPGSIPERLPKAADTAGTDPSFMDDDDGD